MARTNPVIVPARHHRSCHRLRRRVMPQSARFPRSSKPSRKRQHFGTLARYAFQRTRRISESMAKRFGGAIDRDDLMSCGGEAVARCLPSYNPELAPFRGFIDQRLRWAMLHEYRRGERRRIDLTRGRPLLVAQRYRDVFPGRVGFSTPDGLRSRPSALEFRNPQSAGRLCPSGDLRDAAVAREPTPEERLIGVRQDEAFRALIASLGAESERILLRHYYDGASFADVASELKMSRSAVCRIHRRALRSLERRLPARAQSLDQLEFG